MKSLLMGSYLDQLVTECYWLVALWQANLTQLLRDMPYAYCNCLALGVAFQKMVKAMLLV